MAANRALFLALDLAARPGLARAMRLQPLPPDVLTVIRVAAADPEALTRATAATGRSPERVRQAAVFYIQQVLFDPAADHYRVLGARSDAPHETLREHMRWLMQWLHPDRTKSDWESVFARKVLEAWQEVGSADRRAQYDRDLGVNGVGRRRGFGGSRRHLVRMIPLIPWILTTPRTSAGASRRSKLHLVTAAALVGAVAFTLALWAMTWWNGPTPSSSERDVSPYEASAMTRGEAPEN